MKNIGKVYFENSPFAEIEVVEGGFIVMNKIQGFPISTVVVDKSGFEREIPTVYKTYSEASSNRAFLAQHYGICERAFR